MCSSLASTRNRSLSDSLKTHHWRHKKKTEDANEIFDQNSTQYLVRELLPAMKKLDKTLTHFVLINRITNKLLVIHY